jgi:hypothetical protein
MKRQSILSTPKLEELKRQKRRVIRNKILIAIFLFLILVVGLAFLSRWKKINIENVEISGNKVVDKESIENIVRNDISSHYLWIFPKTNFLIYPKKQIEKDLAEKYKRLSSIKINVKDFKTIQINVTEYEGKFTWCGDALPDANGDDNQNCYFLDQNGYVFDKAPYFSGNVYFRFFGNIPRGDSVEPTGYNFASDNFSKLIAFKDVLFRTGLKPSAFYLTDDGDIDIFLSSAQLLPNDHVILVKADADFEKVTENLQAALNTEPLQAEFKTKYSTLQYIDLRFGNKVYFKFK